MSVLRRSASSLGHGDVEDVAAELGVTQALARVLGAVRESSGPWDEAALSADLDELDVAFTGWGIDGGLTGQVRSFRPLQGAGAHPVVDVWMCPAGRCSRAVPVTSDGGTPVCAVTEGPCTLRRLLT